MLIGSTDLKAEARRAIARSPAFFPYTVSIGSA